MAVAQRNFDYFAYESDDGTTYCLRGDEDWGNAAASGGSACAGEPAYGPASPRRSPRYALFRDPTTFRTFKSPVYTPDAYAALTVGTSTFNQAIPGSASAQAYTLVKKIPEQIPSTVVGRQLGDHA